MGTRRRKPSKAQRSRGISSEEQSRGFEDLESSAGLVFMLATAPTLQKPQMLALFGPAALPSCDSVGGVALCSHVPEWDPRWSAGRGP